MWAPTQGRVPHPSWEPRKEGPKWGARCKTSACGAQGGGKASGAWRHAQRVAAGCSGGAATAGCAKSGRAAGGAAPARLGAECIGVRVRHHAHPAAVALAIRLLLTAGVGCVRRLVVAGALALPTRGAGRACRHSTASQRQVSTEQAATGEATHLTTSAMATLYSKLQARLKACCEPSAGIRSCTQT